jgi:hypothetical protein
MALATTALPYGMRDIRISTLNDDGSLQTPVDLPNAQVLSFSEAEDFEELRGDDQVVALRGKGPKVEWSLEAGGITLAAYKAIVGGTNTTTGSTPNQVKTYRKLGTDARPYFKAEGQSISDGSQEDGKFWITKLGGTAIPNTSGILYDFVQNETATAIP